MGNLILSVVPGWYFYGSYPDITNFFKLFCFGITQVGTSSTQNGPRGLVGWKIAENP